MVTSANLTYRWNGSPISAQELHEADREEPSALAGAIDSIQRILHRKPSNAYAFLFQPLPWKEVGRKFLAERHHPIAGLPVQSHGDGGDALGRIFHQRDLGRLGVDQAGGGEADPVVGFEPVFIVDTAVIQTVVRQPLHRLRRTTA